MLWMKEDPRSDSYFTTMFDLYGLPGDFPGHAEAGNLADVYSRVARLEEALARAMGHRRFIPYIQLHEFEALLFADPAKLKSRFPEHEDGIRRLGKLAIECEPERIDDGQDTHPAMRIAAEIPQYAAAKASAGPLVAAHIGLPTLRRRCPHFDGWISRLERLPESAAGESGLGAS